MQFGRHRIFAFGVEVMNPPWAAMQPLETRVIQD